MHTYKMKIKKRILVFPAASRPSIKIRISLLPKILAKVFDTDTPIVVIYYCYYIICKATIFFIFFLMNEF